MDFAPNATPRVVWIYTSAGVVHNIMIRRPRNETQSASLVSARSTLESLFIALKPLTAVNTAWLDERYIAQDTDVGVPTGYSGPTSLSGNVANGMYTPLKKVVATNFSGRSTGSRARVVVYGCWFNFDTAGAIAQDGKVLGTEDPAIQAAINVLNGINGAYAIDGVKAVFANVANVKVNDFLLKRVRRGIIA